MWLVPALKNWIRERCGAALGMGGRRRACRGVWRGRRGLGILAEETFDVDSMNLHIFLIKNGVPGALASRGLYLIMICHDWCITFTKGLAVI